MDNNENEVNENVENTSNEVKQEDPIKTETKTDNNEPIKEKKKTNVGLIVTIIILSVIIVIGLFVGLGIFVFNKFKATLNNTPINDITSMIQEGENQLADAEATLNNSLENAGLNDVFGTLTNAVDNGTTVQPSSNARTSSLENPLKVGEWGIASKYNTNTRSDQNVNVKVTNIIRGDEAKKMAQDYMNSDYSIYKYEEPEGYQEWVVIEYDVDFADTYVPGELGASPDVNADITGPDGKAIKYNGITYINSVIEIGSRDYIKTKTGSGKTTITNLLNRFYEIQKGEILLDGINIKEINIKSLRQKIGVILQDPFIFARSIKENIQLSNEFSKEKIQQAISLASADEFIKSLPNGIDEIAKERGEAYSAGQKQLIAFARVFAHNPSIFILDEATANIDTKTEEFIQKSVDLIAKNKTSIFIAHRLSTVVNVDKIIVLSNGKIVEQGNHKTLIQQGGLYSKLYEYGSLDID